MFDMFGYVIMFDLIELIMFLNSVVVFEQRPYLLKIQLNHGFCAKSKKRQNYYSLVRRNKMAHQFYSRFRNFFTNHIGQAKINYFARKFQQLFKGDCKSTWKQINSIIRPNRITKKNIINKICENDITYVTKHDISNVLYSYFVNIGKRVSESMHAGPYDHYQYIKGNYVNSLFFAPVSSADVEKIILRNKPGNINNKNTIIIHFIETRLQDIQLAQQQKYRWLG